MLFVKLKLCSPSPDGRGRAVGWVKPNLIVLNSALSQSERENCTLTPTFSHTAHSLTRLTSSPVRVVSQCVKGIYYLKPYPLMQFRFYLIWTGIIKQIKSSSLFGLSTVADKLAFKPIMTSSLSMYFNTSKTNL